MEVVKHGTFPNFLRYQGWRGEGARGGTEGKKREARAGEWNEWRPTCWGEKEMDGWGVGVSKRRIGNEVLADERDRLV